MFSSEFGLENPLKGYELPIFWENDESLFAFDISVLFYTFRISKEDVKSECWEL